MLSTYAIFAGAYTYLQMRPDIVRDGIRLPLVGLVGKKELSKAELESMKTRAERKARILAPLGLIIAVLISPKLLLV